MNIIFLILIILSFLIVYFLTPFWIRKAKQIGLVWDDMNKLKSEKIAGSGGFIVVLSFVFVSLIYLGFLTFFLKDSTNTISILSILLAVSLLTLTGFIDDILGWKKGGLSKRSRLLVILFASVPLMVVNAGKSTISLPLIGPFDMGILYALIIIPIGIVGASAVYNFLAGFNGLESGQGIIILSGIALVSYLTGNAWISFLSLLMVSSLLAFLFFNFYPAKVFPGNSITLVLGALITMFSIFGNFEKIALFFFIPYIIELCLKSRGLLIKQSFGKPNKDGSLSLRYDKLYSLNHLGIFLLQKAGIKPTEKRVVYLIWLFQAIIIILGLIIFREGIFV